MCLRELFFCVLVFIQENIIVLIFLKMHNFLKLIKVSFFSLFYFIKHLNMIVCII